MNKTIIICTIFFLLTSFQPNTVHPVINPNPTFIDGEDMRFSLHYGIIEAGQAMLTLKQEPLNGTTVFHSVVKANTVGLAERFFKVVDIYESYFEPNSNLPLKAIRNVHEGSYKQYMESTFDHRLNTVHLQSKGDIKVPENILDMVSALYYLRRVDFTNFKMNDVIDIITFFGDEVFPFYVVYKGREVLDTDLGKYKCLKFVPVVEPGRIFKKKDDMTVWLSDDANKIPIRVKFDLIVGSFKCDLISFKNQKYQMSSKINVH